MWFCASCVCTHSPFLSFPFSIFKKCTNKLLKMWKLYVWQVWKKIWRPWFGWFHLEIVAIPYWIIWKAMIYRYMYCVKQSKVYQGKILDEVYIVLLFFYCLSTKMLKSFECLTDVLLCLWTCFKADLHTLIMLNTPHSMLNVDTDSIFFVAVQLCICTVKFEAFHCMS